MISNVEKRTQYTHSPQQLLKLTTITEEESNLAARLQTKGASVNRLKSRYGFPDTISAKTLGEYDEPTVIIVIFEKWRKTLAEVGINLNFAPVVDVDLNPIHNPSATGTQFFE
ncbi:MAG: hypothetical protein R3E08_01890 [Thiotrichaceae bacterium]